jgi:hypothetical protein
MTLKSDLENFLGQENVSKDTEIYKVSHLFPRSGL